MKKCRICKKEFEPFSSLARVCSGKCALELVKQKKDKKHKKELIAFRKGDKSIAKLRAEAQKEVNAYIRLRDENKPCISCGAVSVQIYGGYRGAGGWDAGHYRSRGSCKHLAFNCYNISKQCVKCNRFDSGSAVDFRLGLIKRIGLERVERLENDNAVRKFDKEYLIRIKKIFAERTRHLKRIRSKSL